MINADQLSEQEGQAKLQEAADVKAWLKRITDARKFDEAARKQYALDRRYARGDAGDFDVDVPIAGSYVDILKSFLYARDPDLDILPSDATNPPPIADLMDMAREEIKADPAAQQQAMQAGIMAAQQAAQTEQQQALSALTGGDPAATAASLPVNPAEAGQQAMVMAMEDAAKARAEELAAPYKQRQQQAKQLADTLELVVSRLWKKARLKQQAETAVGSGLSVALGWIKATWQERKGDDPLMRTAINDLQDNLKRLAADQRELAEGGAPDDDAIKASIEQQIAGLESKVEVVIARGFAVDFIPAEDVQVSTDVDNLGCYRDASWIATRTFLPADAAKAAFPAVAEKIGNANSYFQVKPTDPTERRESGGLATDIDARDADTYRSGSGQTDASSANICVWEVQHRETNQVITLIEGLDCYGVAPYAPNPGTSRFYNLFQWAPVKVDGERHPQSLIQRSARLLDEYNRTRSNFAEHRRRSLPKLGFDSSNYSPTEIAKLEAGGIGEMVALKPLRPGEPVGNALAPIAYPPIDMVLYDTGPIRAELELIWGIQEALSSSIRTAKTATEAEIQQSGTEARTGYMRDTLDTMLSDLAEYTAEVALQKMSREDVKAIAGPWAFWPEGMSIEDMASLLHIEIRAGSSGKPNTTAQREAWAATVPLLQNAVMQIGQLRGSNPEDIADCLEEIVIETLERTGDRIEASRFLPRAPSVPSPQQIAQEGLPT